MRCVILGRDKSWPSTISCLFVSLLIFLFVFILPSIQPNSSSSLLIVLLLSPCPMCVKFFKRSFLMWPRNPICLFLIQSISFLKTSPSFICSWNNIWIMRNFVSYIVVMKYEFISNKNVAFLLLIKPTFDENRIFVLIFIHAKKSWNCVFYPNI